MITEVGTDSHPLRVAIIGSGPAGFYAADHLLKQNGVAVEIDIFDRLPTPYGLVRAGVAPDHYKIKSVTRVYDKIAANPNVRFYGNVDYGRDLCLENVKAHYHQIVFATGAATDRRLDIPGIDLAGSHSATEFVAWYNGHPDYRDRVFDLSQARAAVIGVGNVAMDVARILCRTAEEMRATDIADYALLELAKSRVREVFILGRRGPVQAAFTVPEIKELGELAETDVSTLSRDLDQADGTGDQAQDRSVKRKVELLKALAVRKPAGSPRKLTLRFLVSPVELVSDEWGHVSSIRLVNNELYETEAGTVRSRPTDEYEQLPVDLVFRSIGYRGVPLPDVPFNEDWGVIHNRKGRVVDPESQQHLVGLYTAGWIKRGPSGVIGTNKSDAVETVDCMVKDLANGATFHPAHPEKECVAELVRQRKADHFTYEDWVRLDEIEVSKGRAQGRPRVKFTSVEEMLAAIGR